AIAGILAPRAVPECLVLDDEWNPERVLSTAKWRRGYHSTVDQPCFGIIRDQICAGETGEYIGSRERIGMIVIPNETCALVVGVGVNYAPSIRRVQETGAVHEAIRIVRVGKPGERAAVGVPEDKTAVEMNRNAVRPSSSLGSHNGIDERWIHRQYVCGR